MRSESSRLLTDWNTCRKYAKAVLKLHEEVDYERSDFDTEWRNIKDRPSIDRIHLVYSVSKGLLERSDNSHDEFSLASMAETHNTVPLSQWIVQVDSPEISASFISEIKTHVDESRGKAAPLQQTLTRWVQNQEFTLTDEAPLAGWSEAQQLASLAINTYKEGEGSFYTDLQSVWPSNVALLKEPVFEFYFNKSNFDQQENRNDIARAIQQYDKSKDVPEEYKEANQLSVEKPDYITTDDETWETFVEVADGIADKFYRKEGIYNPDEYSVELPSRTSILQLQKPIKADTDEEWVQIMAEKLVQWKNGEIKPIVSPYNPSRKNA